MGQVVEAANPPEDISSYVLKENKVKMIRPKDNAETREFLGLHETVRFMVVSGSPDEVFFNYGYDKDKSKVLCYHTDEGFQILSSEPSLIVTGR